MAKKQKAKDKTDLKDNSIDAEVDLEEAESSEDEVDSLDEDSDESYNPEEKIKDLEEALLRSRAELDNAFKRNTADIEKAHKYGVERLLNELLPVVDNLEHALNNFSKDSTKEDRQGVELTLKSFESAGIVMRHNFEEGHAVYEITPDDHHDHMVCLETGKVIEFHDEMIEKRQESIASEMGYEIVDHSMVLYVKPIK